MVYRRWCYYFSRSKCHSFDKLIASWCSAK